MDAGTYCSVIIEVEPPLNPRPLLPVKRTFELPELLEEILDSTVCMAERKVDKATLAAAARVSRDWSELALDVLWREVKLAHALDILASLCTAISMSI